MDDKLKRDIILEHYQNPVNRGFIDNNNYIKVNSRNESCVDNITVGLLLDKGVIIDARFEGEACAICTSATSIMIKTIIGKTIDEAREIIKDFDNMVNEKKYDASKLDELNVYNTIYRQPNRINCALLPFKAVKDILGERE